MLQSCRHFYTAERAPMATLKNICCIYCGNCCWSSNWVRNNASLELNSVSKLRNQNFFRFPKSCLLFLSRQLTAQVTIHSHFKANLCSTWFTLWTIYVVDLKTALILYALQKSLVWQSRSTRSILSYWNCNHHLTARRLSKNLNICVLLFTLRSAFLFMKERMPNAKIAKSNEVWN